MTRDGGGTAEWALTIAILRVCLSACEIRLKVLVSRDLRVSCVGYGFETGILGLSDGRPLGMGLV